MPPVHTVRWPKHTRGLLTGRLHLEKRDPPLTDLPPEVFDLVFDTPPAWYTRDTPWAQRSDLHVLTAGDNELTTVDERIGTLRALSRLELQKNRLASLPPALGTLGRLSVLSLAHNALTQLPACLLTLPLTSLNVSHNRLKTLWQASDFSNGALRMLRHLDVSHNEIHTASIGVLPASLQRLDLSHNKLQGPLPAALFAPLVELEDLALGGNELHDTVFARDGSTRALPRLAVLDVRGARVTALAALEAAFASAPSLSFAEARDKHRTPPTAPGAAAQDATPAFVAHQLVRVAARPNDEMRSVSVSVNGATVMLPPLYVLSDVQVRTESHRRKRGGRGRGGEDRARAREEHEDSAPPNAGSALANAKLSTKKKEALGQVPCKFFRNNGCSAGDACPFAHTLPGEGQPKAVCQWYLKGSCRFGHRCALAHILPGQPMSVRCFSCTFSHRWTVKTSVPPNRAYQLRQRKSAARKSSRNRSDRSPARQCTFQRQKTRVRVPLLLWPRPPHRRWRRRQKMPLCHGLATSVLTRRVRLNLRSLMRRDRRHARWRRRFQRLGRVHLAIQARMVYSLMLVPMRA